jgi:hypothetical protein
MWKKILRDMYLLMIQDAMLPVRLTLPTAMLIATFALPTLGFILKRILLAT